MHSIKCNKLIMISLIISFILVGFSDINAETQKYSVFYEFPGRLNSSLYESVIDVNNWYINSNGKGEDSNELEPNFVVKIGDTWHIWIGWSLIYVAIEKD